MLLLISASCRNKEEPVNKPTAAQKEKYQSLIKKASQLYYSKDYLKSARKYSEAFKIIGDKSATTDRYNAACSWALANKIDSSYIQLFRAAEKGGYSDYSHILADTDLSKLHTHKKWKNLLEIIKNNKEKKEINLDKSLVSILDSIHRIDQSVRSKFHKALKEHGSESDEFKIAIKVMLEQDSINIIKIEKILNEYGWLGIDVIGEKGNQTLFLVIQHAELKVQEKYLPMLREAVKHKNAQPSQLALLEDRVAVRNGKKQIYGSQTRIDNKTGENYFMPIEDPENVDARRANVGLESIANYAESFNITWNVEEHKTMTKKIELEKR
ncbi:MAG: DUF6624 domain-containing protein [Saprospiraceae bacterium]